MKLFSALHGSGAGPWVQRQEIAGDSKHHLSTHEARYVIRAGLGVSNVILTARS